MKSQAKKLTYVTISGVILLHEIEHAYLQVVKLNNAKDVQHFQISREVDQPREVLGYLVSVLNRPKYFNNVMYRKALNGILYDFNSSSKSDQLNFSSLALSTENKE